MAGAGAQPDPGARRVRRPWNAGSAAGGADWQLAGGALAAVLLLYPLVWWLGFQVSNSYWFVPVGVRVAALLRVPVRWWWALLAGEYATALVVMVSFGYELTLAGIVFGNAIPWAAYALAVLAWRRRSDSPLPRSPLSFARLLLACLAAAVFTALSLLLLRWFDGRLQDVSVADELFSLLIGDYVGLLVMAPVLVQIGDPRAAWRQLAMWRSLLASVLPLAATLMLVALQQPAALPYAALFAILPPILLARRFGWRGAAVAFSLVSAAVYFSTSGLVDAQIASLLQFYLALVGAAALILGAWVTFEGRLRARLEQGLTELAHANAQLESQTLEMRELGRRLVRAQEDERQRIRADLRGELSQQISLLATQLSLLVREVDRPQLMAMVDGLRTHVQALRDAADDCLENLQPRDLSHRGLPGALRDGAPAQALSRAGVQLDTQIEGAERRLAEVDRMHVYRSFQHLVALTLRFSDAERLTLRLTVPEAEGPVPVSFEARLQCRSPLSLDAVRGEADLQALRDRLFAAGGEALVEVDAHGALVVRGRFESLGTTTASA